MLEIHKADNFIDLLTLIQNSRSRGSGKFSYRQLADKLGYRSPRTLAMVHKGQRLPNHNLVRKIIYYFGFSPYEIELTFLFVEKALAEKKHQVPPELDQKIQVLKKRIENLRIPKPALHCLEKFLYLDHSEFNQVINQIEIYFSNLENHHPPIEAENKKSLIKLKLSMDSS